MKKIALMAGIAVLIFAGGYGAGRFASPQKVVITEKLIQVEKQVVVTQTKTETQLVKVYLKDQKERIHRVVTDVTAPDGTITKKIEEDINTDTVVHQNDTEVKWVEKWNERITERLLEKDRQVLVMQRSDWDVGVQVGVSLPALLGRDTFNIMTPRGAVIGAYLNRRILGPFYIGIWGNSQGATGIGVSGAF